MTELMTGNSGPRAGAPRPMVSCWCCGILAPVAGRGAARADQLCGPSKYLCPACWAAQPRATTQAVRGASALRLALGLGQQQPDGEQALALVAAALDIRSWRT